MGVGVSCDVFCFLVNFDKIVFIYSISSKVETYEILNTKLKKFMKTDKNQLKNRKTIRKIKNHMTNDKNHMNNYKNHIKIQIRIAQKFRPNF